MVDYLSPWVYATMRCPLACRYCYVGQNGADISSDTLRRIGEVFPRLVRDGEVGEVVFRLAGGEPLLAFDFWKDTFARIVEPAENKCSVGLLTNLTVLNREMVEWAKRYAKGGISTSLDGLTVSKPFHDGSSSAKTVMGNIETLLANEFRHDISITTVLSESNLKELPELAKKMVDWDVDWSINLDHYYDGGIGSGEILAAMVGAIEALLVGGYDMIHRFKFNNVSLAAGYDGCTAGEKLFAIGVNGEIWPCQTLSDRDPVGWLGDDLLEVLEVGSCDYGCGAHFTLAAECQECALRSQCHGGCQLHGKRGQACRITKRVFYLVSQLV